jgi:hypothetical protein
MKISSIIYVLLLFSSFAFSQSNNNNTIENKEAKIKLNELVEFYKKNNLPLNANQEEEIYQIFILMQNKKDRINSDANLVTEQKKENVSRSNQESDKLVYEKLSAEQRKMFSVYLEK